VIDSEIGCKKCKSWSHVVCEGYGGILFCEKCNPNQPERSKREDGICEYCEDFEKNAICPFYHTKIQCSNTDAVL
jgi:hypothetical protein